MIRIAFVLTFFTLSLLAAEAPKPLRALLIAGGCCHDYGKQKDVLKEGLEARAHVQVDIVYSPDTTTRARFDIYEKPDWAKGYDVIIHDDCTSDVKDQAYVQNILNAHKTVPAVNLHCAMHAYRVGTDDWFKFVGIQSTGHGPQEPIAIQFLDTEHPITKGLTNWTTIREELYNNVKQFDTAKPLARGKQIVKQRDGSTREVDYVVAWVNDYGGTRVFSTTLGHNTATVADDRYLELVTRGLLWAANKEGARYRKYATEPRVGGKSNFADFGGNKVHYVTTGSGDQTLVFIHGWSGNANLWNEQVPAVASKAKLIFIDLPGHGQSDKPRANYTMDFFADGALAALRHAKVEKATLVGHSMGVAVICRMHAKAPELVSGLVAVDGFLKRPELKPEQVEQFAGPYRGPGYREHTIKFIHSMFPHPGTEAARDRMVNDVLKTPQHVMASAMEQMFNSAEPNWDLKRVEIPLIAINAPNPRWTSEYEAYVKALSPKSEYKVVEGVGHCLTVEKPSAFNAVFVELLAKHNLINK
jgi:pimeloyl-ACP methyl ester carboxylesterase/type 1 glutamine amidotransferase